MGFIILKLLAFIILGAVSVQALEISDAAKTNPLKSGDYFIKTIDERYICFTSEKGFFIDNANQRTIFKVLLNDDGQIALNFAGNKYIGVQPDSQEIYASDNRREAQY